MYRSVPSFESVANIRDSFGFFTIYSIFGILYVVYIVSETKGKKLDEIQEMLNSIVSPLPRGFLCIVVIIIILKESTLNIGGTYNINSGYNNTHNNNTHNNNTGY